MQIRLSIGLFLGVALTASGAIQKGSIEVAALKGPSDLINFQKKRAPLSRGLTFQEGNQVETQEKSTAELLLSNGSTIMVSPGTLMEVKTFSQVTSPLIVPGKYQQLSAEPTPSVVQIEVFRGKIDGEVRKLNPNTQYTIKTPVGLVRVRGTIFSVSYKEDKSGRGIMNVNCAAGSVMIRSNSSNGSTSIGPGEKHEVVGKPDNVISAPAKPADINNDGVPDMPVDSDGDGKADGLDVDGDGKADKLVSTRPDGRLDGIDVNGDGVPDSQIIGADGAPEIAIDANGDGLPEAVVTIDAVGKDGGYVSTPLTYPDAIAPNGKPVIVEQPPVDLPPPPPPPPPPDPLPPPPDIVDKIVDNQVSPSGG